MTPTQPTALEGVKTPVTVKETIYDDWAICDATGAEIARQILYSRDAHAIAHALNSQGKMVAALQELAECDLNDGNCASLEVASKRIRNIARSAIQGAKGG